MGFKKTLGIPWLTGSLRMVNHGTEKIRPAFVMKGSTPIAIILGSNMTVDSYGLVSQMRKNRPSSVSNPTVDGSEIWRSPVDTQKITIFHGVFIHPKFCFIGFHRFFSEFYT